MIELKVDTKGLRALALAAREVDPAIEKDLQVGLEAGGEIVAVRARTNARSFPRKGPGTSRIADSVRVKRRATKVRVQAGGSGAPEAAPLELGSKGGGGTILRHPLFGDRENWYSQPAHPFLRPAAAESAPEVEAFVVGLVDVTLARLAI